MRRPVIAQPPVSVRRCDAPARGRPRAPGLLLVAASLTLGIGCGSGSSPSDGGAPGGDDPAADGGELPARYSAAACPTGPVAPLESTAQRFADEVFPLMTRPRQEGGCTDCHSATSGRTLRVDGDGIATFYRLRTEQLFALDSPGSMLSRLVRTSSSAMPPGGPRWSDADIDKLYGVMCELGRTQSTVPPDEQFPPELLLPYGGAPSLLYENRTLSYRQLRGRIKAQFGDDWVRDGVNRFEANAARFGGVDFRTIFVPQWQITADYLLGLDTLAAEVCSSAVEGRTGPFSGIDVAAPILDETAPSTFRYELENATRPGEAPLPSAAGWATPSMVTGRTGSTDPAQQTYNPRALGLYVNTSVTGPFDAPIQGTYRVTVRARGLELPPELPNLDIAVNGQVRASRPIPADANPSTTGTDWTLATADLQLNAGRQLIGLAFTNDGYVDCATVPVGTPCGDRNLLLDWVTITGPLPGTSVGAPGGKAAAKGRLASLFGSILLRPPLEQPMNDELEPLHALLTELEAIDGNRGQAWAGICESLLKHPDFLFTRRPSADGPMPLERARALLVRTALDLLDRPPTQAELARFDAGTPRSTFIDEWLASTEFKSAYFYKVRLLLESDGSADADEPARLWLYLTSSDSPIKDLLTANYTTRSAKPDLSDLTTAQRFAEYGPTGLLVMRGYLRNKPGLPHYNYAARVLSDFLGHVFEVPSTIVDSRAGASPTSTVQPGSVCYSCHQLLTPLAYQRSGWDDDGLPRATDATGAPVDDSDRGLVSSYPYAGKGMASFAAKAVRKERFIRRMANSQAEMLLGRPLRAETDERTLYEALFTAANGGAGSFRSLLRILLDSDAYTQAGVGP